MLDSMDVMLYALVLGAVQREMHLRPAMSGAMMSATLISAAVGGTGLRLVCGPLWPVRALSTSILVYSVRDGAVRVHATATELMACRLLLGLGMGGEWAAGAALVAETWPARHRGKALAVVQSSWAVGYALGAAVVAVVMPRFGWRAVFFVGVAPALVTLWLQRRLKEPEVWRQARAERASQGALVQIRALFKGTLGRSVLVCATMNAATLFAWWGLFTWVPRFLSLPVAEGGRGLSVVQTSGWTIVMEVGTFLGDVSLDIWRIGLGRSGRISDTCWRRRCWCRCMPLCAARRRCWCRGRWWVLWDGLLQRVRRDCQRAVSDGGAGSAMGFVYNIGRVLSAGAPYMIGASSERWGLSAALSTTAGAFLVAAVIATALRLPEGAGAAAGT